jgi:hypothetical protein
MLPALLPALLPPPRQTAPMPLAAAAAECDVPLALTRRSQYKPHSIQSSSYEWLVPEYARQDALLYKGGAGCQ